MTTSVIISFQLEGLHHWPEANDHFPDVGFLRYPHRHMFHFKLSKLVTHTDRDVEFIRWKRQVIKYLQTNYTVITGVQDDSIVRNGNFLDFNRMSCEDIATELLNKFDCLWVEVWEDGENGARVEK